MNLDEGSNITQISIKIFLGPFNGINNTLRLGEEPQTDPKKWLKSFNAGAATVDGAQGHELYVYNKTNYKYIDRKANHIKWVLIQHN